MPALLLHQSRLTASKLFPSSLPVVDASTLCPDFLKGFCRRGHQCTQNHEICRVEGDPSREALDCAPNFLSLGPRLLPSGCSPFEDNGPGHLSADGPRHDNDYVEIQAVKILPTTDEMLSLRVPYMPRKDIDAPNHLRGSKRHIDALFRQLRYESIEPIIDANYHATQQLVLMGYQQWSANYDARMSTPKGVRYSFFQDIHFEESVFHPSKGIMFRISFACPPELRGRRMGVSRSLEEGMLVTLIGVSAEGVSMTYLEVHHRQSTEALRLRTGNDLRAAVILSLADRRDIDAVRRLMYNKCDILRERFAMVEIPGTLYAGFHYTLRTLQQQYVSEADFAFQHVIAPNAPLVPPDIPPPTYTEEEGFSYQLDCLSPTAISHDQQPNTLRPQELMSSLEAMQSAVDKLSTVTTLDKGQSRALCETLCRGLALIQGAPGSGKTFLAVALAKVLLASNTGHDRKPILVIALTNHALDSFLADLRDAGIVTFARLGSMSKETWTKEFELQKLGRKQKHTTAESSTASHANYQIEALWSEGASWCESLNNTSTVSWPALRDLLSKTDPVLLRAFTDLETVDQSKLADIRLARKAGGFAFEYWCSGKDLRDIDALLEHFDAFAQNTQWLEQLADDPWLVRQRIGGSIHGHASVLHDKSSGIWTLPLIERERLVQIWGTQIKPRTVIDRAAEIHHRHQLAVQRKWDILDEWDVKTLAEQDVIAMTTTVAARQWANLKKLGIRVTICEEAAEVSEAQFLSSLLPTVLHCISIGDPLQLRPTVNEKALSIETGIGSQYRLDESLMERLMMPSDPRVASLAASRLYIQRRMHPQIANLLRKTHYPYLEDHEELKNCAPVPGIADRVWWLHHNKPENTQKSAAHPMSYTNKYEVEMISGLVEYLVSSNEYNYRDITILTPYNGQLAAFYERLRTMCSIWLSEKDRQAMTIQGYLDNEDKSTGPTAVELGSMLRLATVDNFQGEESRVVILSLVRSNAEGRMGFLKTPNRINVAISRAKIGLYIIGNASIMNQVPMWRIIIEELASKNQLGRYMRICCPRHATTVHRVWKPTHWYTLPKCLVPCDFKFACGHRCIETCHSLAIHAREGDTKCPRKASTVQLPCGHEFTITCQQALLGKDTDIECTRIVGHRTLECGHLQNIACFRARDEATPCGATCGKALSCSHLCRRLCGECTSIGCQQCTMSCGKTLTCGHYCQAKCHEGQDCPPCNLQCLQSCCHGRCERRCSEPCYPCMKRCGNGTGKASDSTKMLLPCGHVFNIVVLDQHFELRNVYSVNDAGIIEGIVNSGPASSPHFWSRRCPTCRESCKGVRRFDIFYKLEELYGTIDRAQASWNRRINRYLDDITKVRMELTDTFNAFQSNLSHGLLAAERNRKMVIERGNIMIDLELAIAQLTGDVVRPFEKALMSLKGFLGKLIPLEEYTFASSLRFESLIYRCRLVTLEENCQMVQAISATTNESLQPHHIKILAQGVKAVTIPTIANNLIGISDLIVACQCRKMARLEAEVRLTRLAAMIALDTIDTANALVGATEDLAACRRLCNTYPLTAGTLTPSYIKVHKALSRRKDAVVGHPIYAKATMQAWWRWPRHEIGDLRKCDSGHPFSGVSMEHCPECGPATEVETPRDIDYEATLGGQEFVEAVKELRFDGAKYRRQGMVE